MNFEDYVKMMEPEYTEADLYEMKYDSQIEAYECEQADQNALIAWGKKYEVEPTDEELEAIYDEYLQSGGI